MKYYSSWSIATSSLLVLSLITQSTVTALPPVAKPAVAVAPPAGKASVAVVKPSVAVVKSSVAVVKPSVSISSPAAKVSVVVGKPSVSGSPTSGQPEQPCSQKACTGCAQGAKKPPGPGFVALPASTNCEAMKTLEVPAPLDRRSITTSADNQTHFNGDPVDDSHALQSRVLPVIPTGGGWGHYMRLIQQLNTADAWGNQVGLVSGSWYVNYRILKHISFLAKRKQLLTF